MVLVRQWNFPREKGDKHLTTKVLQESSLQPTILGVSLHNMGIKFESVNSLVNMDPISFGNSKGHHYHLPSKGHSSMLDASMFGGLGYDNLKHGVSFM